MKYRIVHTHCCVPPIVDIEMKKWWQLKWTFICRMNNIEDAVNKIELDYRYLKSFKIVQPFRTQ